MKESSKLIKIKTFLQNQFLTYLIFNFRPAICVLVENNHIKLYSISYIITKTSGP